MEQDQNLEPAPQKSRFLTTRNIAIFGIIAFIFVIVLAILYYFLLVGKSGLPGSDKKETQPSQKTTVGSQSISIELDQIDDSRQGGVATLTEIDGKTSVLIQLDSVLGVIIQPTNIYNGACPKPGNSVAYALNNINEGESETILDENLASLVGKNLSIVVHKSEEEVGVNVNCGDIK